ncbi:hypothetical protein [Synechococcus phage DSL-LC03]|nr:hypothetical protein [Synechococcus phage DSL-LC03]
MNEFPWGVLIIISSGLFFTAYCIYYILKLAHEEMSDETSKSNSISDKSEH